MAKAFFNEDLYNGFLQPSLENLFYDTATNNNENLENFSSHRTAARTTNLYSRGFTSNDRQLARPSTAIRPVGYTSEVGRTFDPMLHPNAAKKSIVFEKKNQEPQEKYRNLEKKIQNLLEESILSSTELKPNLVQSLNRGKEASSLDRTLLRLRDQNNETGFHNFDLTYSVFFNLANIYTKNEMYIEALNTYNIMIKNKMFQNVNRLKMNMGNIYYHMGLYSKAIKMYRMALDQVPNNQKELRLKITHNIGILFIKLGQYSDAAASFEFILSESGDIKSVIHLILCYYAIGDNEKIKKTFRTLCDLQIDYNDDIKMQTDLDNDNTMNQTIYEIIRNDRLSIYFNNKKKFAETSIVMIVNLISPIIEEIYNDGYNWCIEVIKSSNFTLLGNQLELNRAIIYLRQNDINKAIETLKFYEKNEPSIAVIAVTNLVFIYLYLGDLQNATKYSEISRKIDSYNPAAFINSGCCEYLKGNLEMAKIHFEQALDIDMTSFQANYNLGLITKQLLINNKIYDKNLEIYFNKIEQNLSHAKHSHIYYEIGKIYELNNDLNNSLNYYLQLLSITNEFDPNIYKKIAEIYDNFNDNQESNQYLYESFRINPSDINVASTIGSYFIQVQATEKAIYYYERAILANPNEPNLMLRVATCFRHIYNSQKYLSLFEDIYKRFPENLSCLRALMHVTQALGMTSLNEKYSSEYQRLERILQGRKKINTNSGSQKYDSKGAISKKPNKKNSDEMNSMKSNNSSGRDYADPLGPPSIRPRTGQVTRSFSHESDEELNTDELLPM